MPTYGYEFPAAIEAEVAGLIEREQGRIEPMLQHFRQAIHQIHHPRELKGVQRVQERETAQPVNVKKKHTVRPEFPDAV